MTSHPSEFRLDLIPDEDRLAEYTQQMIAAFEAALVEARQDGRRLQTLAEHAILSEEVERVNGKMSHRLKAVVDGTHAAIDRAIEDAYLREHGLMLKITMLRTARAEGTFYDAVGPKIRNRLVLVRVTEAITRGELARLAGYLNKLCAVPAAAEVSENVREDLVGVQNKLSALKHTHDDLVRQIFDGTLPE